MDPRRPMLDHRKGCWNTEEDAGPQQRMMDPRKDDAGSQKRMLDHRRGCCTTEKNDCGTHGNFPLLRALLNLFKIRSRP